MADPVGVVYRMTDRLQENCDCKRHTTKSSILPERIGQCRKLIWLPACMLVTRCIKNANNSDTCCIVSPMIEYNCESSMLESSVISFWSKES